MDEGVLILSRLILRHGYFPCHQHKVVTNVESLNCMKETEQDIRKNSATPCCYQIFVDSGICRDQLYSKTSRSETTEAGGIVFGKMCSGIITKTKLRGLGPQLYRPRGRRLSAKLVPTLADKRCHVVSATDAPGHILGFVDRSR
jgi:hypothetical protein